MRFLALSFLLPSLAFAGDWTTADSWRQGTVATLQVIDLGQTRWFLKHPVKSVQCSTANCVTTAYYETNPILGKHPSVGQANNVIAASIIGHAAIAYMLPPAWRQGWQYIWIGIEGGAVAHNYRAGVKIDF